MVPSPNRLDAALALSRFGLGSRQGDIDAISSDPRGAVKEEIARRMVPSPQGEELKPTAELLADFYAFQQTQKEMRERKAADAAAGAPADGASQPMASGSPAGAEANRPRSTASHQ
jgi:uncharacterized protein (DUF1800 family)